MIMMNTHFTVIIWAFNNWWWIVFYFLLISWSKMITNICEEFTGILYPTFGQLCHSTFFNRKYVCCSVEVGEIFFQIQVLFLGKIKSFVLNNQDLCLAKSLGNYIRDPDTVSLFYCIASVTSYVRHLKTLHSKTFLYKYLQRIYNCQL